MDENKNHRMKQCVAELIEMFKTNNVPKTVALVTNPQLNVPSNKWSLTNRIIQMIHNTSDSRGFKQWQTAGRHILKSAKAFYIFAPKEYSQYRCICEKILSGNEIKEGKCYFCLTPIVKDDITKNCSFIPVAVFRAEDTAGKPLDCEQIKLPEHRFMDVAKSWGLIINPVAFAGRCYGFYRHNSEIALASPEDIVFYHELAHAAHDRLNLLRKTNPKNNPANEIVAEFVGAVLCYMDNKTTDKISGAYEYLKAYADKSNKTVDKAVLKLLSEIEAVLKLILDEDEKMFSKNKQAGTFQNQAQSANAGVSI